MSTLENSEEIKLFREYLQIPSVHPNVDYGPCVEFLKRQASDLNLPVQIYNPAGANKPVVVMTWRGKDRELPTIMLNSHMDVVPVFAENWDHPPFAAEIDSENRIFARGSQDMKSIGIQYLAAIRQLKEENFEPKRTIHIVFVPDEEIGGRTGMNGFVKSISFKRLNVGFSLDEGFTSPNDDFLVFYAERSIWQINFKISGRAGHGSLLLENTPGEKFQYLLEKLMTLRERQVKLLEDNPNLAVGDVTSINLTKLSGGVQSNVIPPLMEVCFDIRLSINEDHAAFEKQLRDWCSEAGGDIVMEFLNKEPKVPPTPLDASNPFWLAFKGATEELGLTITPRVLPGGTDSRFIREANIPAIGFTPINNTPVLLHDHNEFIRIETFMRGIEIYKKIIMALSNV